MANELTATQALRLLAETKLRPFSKADWLRPFSKADWMAFSGCEGEHPLIGEAATPDCLLIVDDASLVVIYSGEDNSQTLFEGTLISQEALRLYQHATKDGYVTEGGDRDERLRTTD